MKNLDKKCYGKFCKTKAYGLVGCLAFSGFLLVSGVGSEDAHAAVVNGGSDIVATDVHSKEASGVAMTYTTFDSNGSKQVASGSGVFVAPNVMVTVTHNYLDKNKEAGTSFVRGGNSATSYVVMNSESAKRGNNTSSGYDDIIPKGNIHYYNDKEFVTSYSGDLAAVVTEKPVEAMTNGEDHARDLGTARQGDKITFMGYPNDFSSKRLSEESKAKLVNGKMYKVSGTLNSLDTTTGSGTYNTSALGGFSGGPIFNERGEVVGIHQHGTNTDAGDDSSQHGGGLFFTDKHRAWINKMIEDHGIKGWFVNGSDKYYYNDNHKAVVNTERTIDGAKYRFDANGRGILLSGVEKGKVVLRIKDTNGSKLYEKIVSEGNVGTPVSFNFKQDNDVKALFSKNSDAVIVSADGQEFNKKFGDNWSKDYVSKLSLGNTYFDVIVRADKFERTVSGQVDGSGGVNLPKMDDKVKNAPNGERNFGATAIIRTPDGTGSGTLIGNDLVLTVAHNFLKFEDGKVTEKAKGNSDKKYYLALPNGKKVFFTDSDIYYWKKDDSVVGFTHDLALIKLREVIDDVKSADVVSDVPSVNNGDKVSVYGYPDGRMGPVIDTTVTDVVDRGAGLTGIGYTGTKPGASGGGLYNDKGEIIGVHQNGVVNQRSGGLVFSKEQLDWVRSYVNGKPEAPVYKVAEEREDKGKHGKLLEVDDQSLFGWIGELYEDGTYVMKGAKGSDGVYLGNYNGFNQTIFYGDPDKLNKIKRVELGGMLSALFFDLGHGIHPTEIDLTGLTLGDKSQVPFVAYKLDGLTSLILGKDFKLNKDSTLSPFIDGAPKLKLTNEQVTQILKDLALVGKSYGGPLLRNVGVERLDLSTFDNSKIDPRNYNDYTSSDENGKPFNTKVVFKDLIGLKEVVFGDKFDFEKYGRKNTPDAFMDTDLSGVIKVTLVGKKPGNDKFIKDWLNEVKTKLTRTDLGEVALLKDGVFVNTADILLNIDGKTYEDGVYTLGYSSTETELVKHGYKYAGDSSVPFGTKVLQIEGQDGDRLVTYVYTISSTGEVATKPIRFADENYVGTMLDGEYYVGNQKREVHEIDVTVRYEADDSKALNEQEIVNSGSKGLRTIITTYSVNSETGVLYDPVVTEENKPMSERVIKVGTKPKMVEKILEPEMEYVEDPTRERGTDNIVTVGPKGKSVTTITYEVDPKSGKVTEVVGKPVITPAGKTIVKVGTKEKVFTKVIEPEVEYIRDDTRKKGTPNEVTLGPKGAEKVTTTYTVNPKTGDVTEVVGKPVITPAGKTIIKVGTKEEIVTEVIDPIVTYVGDDTRAYGSEPVVKKGTPGYKKRITEYELNPKTGVVTPKERVEAAPPKSGPVITVGTKPKVVIVKRGTETYEVRTEYTVDPKTGKLTEKVTERLLYKVGDDISVEVPKYGGVISGNGIDENGNPIVPPVVNVPEYTGVLSGNVLDGEGGVIEPPVVDMPEYKGVLSGNGIDGEGNIIEPPVVEVPEYTGVISGNGLDGEGGTIEPPVVDVPEYKGDTNEVTQDVVKKELPKVVSTPQGKGGKVLPNTGSEGSYAGVGLAMLAVGAVMVKQRRKLGKRQ
jgi:sialidase A (neuraminidase A)